MATKTPTRPAQTEQRTLRQIWNMCGKKRAFKSERAANQHASRWPLRVYQCPICHCWHTTKFKIVR